MPTWRTSVFLVIYWLPGAWPSVATRLRASAYAWMPWKSARAMLLAVGRVGEPPGLLVVRQARDLGEDAGALRGDEDQERRTAHPLVPDRGVRVAQDGHQLVLDDLGQLPRLRLADVGVHALEEPAEVGQMIARFVVLLARQLLGARVVGRAEVVRLHGVALARRDRVHVDRHEQVGPLDVGDLRPLPERHEGVGVPRHDDVVLRALQEGPELPGDLERDLLLPDALGPGPGVVAAVSRVQHELLDAEGRGHGSRAPSAPGRSGTAGAVASTAARSGALPDRGL